MKRYKDKAGHLVSKLGVSCCKDSSSSESKKSQKPELQIRETAINFKINGEDFSVNSGSTSASLSLARFIRDTANLKGTKISCNQGGCGACVITAKVPDLGSGTPAKKSISVNSCLAPIFNCDGWEITTVEGLGNEANIHPIQERLAVFNGTQCGYCSTGMVMQMNSFLEQNREGSNSIEDIENVLDGNLCRCTGYRPILDAFKTFANEGHIGDIEDVTKKCNRSCSARAIGKVRSKESSEWFYPTSVTDLTAILAQLGTSNYRLVYGNTGRGIYDADTSYQTYISLKNVSELVQYDKQPLILGAGMTLADVITLFQEVSGDSKYAYCQVLADHIKKVAHPSVRNCGSIGGNLMLKHQYKDFPSDLFLLMETVGANLVIKNPDNSESTLSPLAFLELNMDKKFLYKIQMPEISDSQVFTYKTMQRRINTHAYVNAGLTIALDDNFNVQGKPRLVFGGISADFVHAENTENFLVGKNLKNPGVLQGALLELKNETVPDDNPVLASPQYRIHLVQALFYRFVLSALGNSISDELQSGASGISRGISSGIQSYETDPDLYPVNKPVEKYEARLQCTGEAEYGNDIPLVPGELWAALVYSTRGNCELDTVDPSDALAMEGVEAYVDHQDIPGINNAQTEDSNEQIFSTKKVFYAGQTIGLILAENFELAHKAARAVKVTYKNQAKPILGIREALELAPETIKVNKVPIKIGNVDEAMKKAKDVKLIEGEFEVGSQYHFYMETQTVLVRPCEKGQFDVVASAQNMDIVQNMVAQALSIPQNKVNVQCKRVGGAYGGKVVHAGFTAAAAAVASAKVKKPVRLHMDLKSSMDVLGMRHAFLAKYRAGVDEAGKLLFVSLTMYSDSGFSYSGDTSGLTTLTCKNCYEATSWEINTATVLTNIASTTIVRAPGTIVGMAVIENVMEHLAHNLGMDPLEFRMQNMIADAPIVPITEPNILPQIVEHLQASSAYQERKSDIENFNAGNRWKKRGLSLVPMLYGQSSWQGKFYFQLSIFATDATIAISCGAIEMGQGINTKVVQTVAKELNVPMEIISMKPSNTFISPQNSPSWGSWTTDCMCSSAIVACQKLKEKMKVVADTMQNPTWNELVSECNKQNVDLSVRHMGFANNDLPMVNYNIYSATVTEVELDVLTGEVNVKRVDIIEDTGTSISPEIDVGQVEGAFVFSLGLWLTEQLRFDPESGRLLTNDTWEYKVPSCKDIPEDFRVTFNDSKRNTYAGVLGSKAVGEQAMLMGVSVIFALRRAIDAVRRDLGQSPLPFYTLDGPATPEKIQNITLATAEHFTI